MAEPVSDDRSARVWTPERVPLTFPLAGLGERAAAYLVDLIIVVLALFAVLFVYNYWGDIERDLGALSSGGLALALVGMFLLFVAWDVVWEVFGGGATPGKRLVGLRVVDEAGHTPDLLTSIMRNLMRMIDFLPSFYGFGTVLLFFTQTRRAGDLVAGTFVVSERARAGHAMALARQFASTPLEGDVPTASDEQLNRLLRQLELSAELNDRVADRRLTGVLKELAPTLAERARTEGGRAVASVWLLALAQRRAGLVAELGRLENARRALEHARTRLAEEPSERHAEAVDDAIRHAGSALMRASRRGLRSRDSEPLSLALLDAERQRAFRPSTPHLLRRLLREEIPTAIWQERRQVFRASAVFAAAAALGFCLAWADEAVGRALLGDDLAAMVDEGARWTDTIEQQGAFGKAALTIIINNVRVGFLAFAAGLLGGVGTLVLLSFNGLHLGSVFGFAARLGTAGTLGKFILAHGPVELSAICVAGAAGLCVGRAIVSPGRRTRREALRAEGAIGVRVLLGATLAFLVIGTVEGFVSPGALFPWPVNLAVGAGMWLLFFSWVRTGRPRAAAPAGESAAVDGLLPAASSASTR